MAIIGIDLGTTNSLACVYRSGRAERIPNELGEYKTSSAVSVWKTERSWWARRRRSGW